MKFTFEGFFILPGNRQHTAETKERRPIFAGMRICNFRSIPEFTVLPHYPLSKPDARRQPPAGTAKAHGKPAESPQKSRRKPLTVDISDGKDVVQ